jgi:uncharacterized protein
MDALADRATRDPPLGNPSTATRSSVVPIAGPVRSAERVLAPDLARGTMLLFIALANAAGVALGGPGFAAHPVGAERWVNFAMLTLAHARAYPVFAVMFGYGLVQLARRQDAAGATPARVRSVLLRRNATLVVFGFLHATLLYFGDFLGAYGLVGMFASTVLLCRGERVHRVVLWCWGISVLYVVVLAAVAAFQWQWGSGAAAAVPAGEVPSLVATSYADSVRARLIEWPYHTLTVLPLVMIVWLGMWGARRRLLEEAAAHRRLLRCVAAGGLGIAIAGGFPFALAAAGWLQANASANMPIFLLHQVSGMFAGPGYVALFGLAALALSEAPRSPATRTIVSAIAALGQRSLSGYLCQSVAWLLVLAPFTLALGEKFGSAMITGLVVALLVWLATVATAWLLERRGRPGPAEAVVRSVSYGGAR